MSKRDLILRTAIDLVTAFLWDDRKEDEELGKGEIEKAIEAGEVTVDEILDVIREGLEA